MEEDKKHFLCEKDCIIKHMINSSTKEKAIAVLKKFLPGDQSNRDFVAYNGMMYFLRYTSRVKEKLGELPANIHFYMLPCLLMAMKLEEKGCDINFLLDGVLSAKIRAMEREICTVLEMKLYTLSPFFFMKRVWRELPYVHSEYHLANKLIFETLLTDCIIDRKPSLLAVSAFIVSLKDDTLKERVFSIWEKEPICLQRFEIESCVKEMEDHYKKTKSILNWEPTLEKFGVDWLDKHQVCDVDLDELNDEESGEDYEFTFDSELSGPIKINPKNRILKDFPMFDAIYTYEKELEKFYIVRLPKPMKLEDDDDSYKEDESNVGLNKWDKKDLEGGLRKWLTLKHDNIVRCVDLVFTHSDYIFGMFENGMSLADLAVSYEPHLVKSYMHQLLLGISHYHSTLGVHRNIRLESIFFFGNRICIGDLCLNKFASKLKRGRYDTVDVTYRAPELLLCTNDRKIKYGTPVDIWALGCIFGYFMTGQSLFKGSNDMERLISIFSRLGIPDEDNWSSPFYCFSATIEDYRKKIESAGSGFCLAEEFKEDKDAHQLLLAMLCMDPEKRVTAKQALGLPYFGTVAPSL